MKKEAHTLPMINNIPTLYMLHDSTVSWCGVGELNAITSLFLILLRLSLYLISLAHLGPICTCRWKGGDKKAQIYVYIYIRRQPCAGRDGRSVKSEKKDTRKIFRNLKQ